MSKRKQPEEATTELVACVEEATNTLQVEEPQESNVVEGWVIGSEPADNEEEGAVTTVDLELECEDGWEVEALWKLLTRAGYVR